MAALGQYTRLPVASVTATNPSVGTTGTTAPTSATEIGYIVAGNLTGATGTANGLKVDGSGSTQPISGTVTANQGTAGAQKWLVDGSGVTQPVSAASLPLPTGASTSALQTTGNTSLSTIATNTGNIPALGQALAAGSVPVVLTVSQLSTLTPLTTVAVTQSGTWTIATSAGGTAIANAPIQNIYSSTNITTSAYVQLVASTSNKINSVYIFDSSGQAMIFAIGGSGSEVIQLYVPPGGGTFPIQIAASTRIAYKALSANATSGYLIMSFLQ
jgi:hypothetical protein